MRAYGQGSLTLLFQEEHGTPGLEVFLADEVIRASQCKTSKPYELMSDVDLTQGTLPCPWRGGGGTRADQDDPHLDTGKWHAAPIIPGTVLVNLGLALEAWTSGVLRATLHRVNVQPEPVHGGFRERKSMPYFVQPRDQVRFMPPRRVLRWTLTSALHRDAAQVVLTPIKPDGTIEPVEGAKTSLEFYLDRIGATFKATEQQATAEVAVSA